MNKNVILFDLDGTLTDPGLGITNSVIHALARMGMEAPPREELYSFIGPPLIDSFRDRFSLTQEEAVRAMHLYREYFAETGIFENEVYDGIPALLEHLQKAGKRLILATSKPEPFARRIMEHFSLSPYFDFIGGSDMEQVRGTKAAVIEYVLQETGCHPAHCIMIGDRHHDVAGAKTHNIGTIGVLWGYGSEKELTQAGAIALAATPQHLEEILLYGKNGIGRSPEYGLWHQN